MEPRIIGVFDGLYPSAGFGCQPMLEGLPLTRKFKSYVGLKGAEKKLRRWLTEFSFMDIATAADNTDWSGAPVVRIE